MKEEGKKTSPRNEAAISRRHNIDMTQSEIKAGNIIADGRTGNRCVIIDRSGNRWDAWRLMPLGDEDGKCRTVTETVLKRDWNVIGNIATWNT